MLVGDRLLAINEETLRGKPLWKAYSMLRTNCDIVKLLIKRTSSSVLSNVSKGNFLATCSVVGPRVMIRFRDRVMVRVKG